MNSQQGFLDARAAGQRMVWIVVVTRPGQERRAAREIAGLGFQVYLPMKLSENKRREIVASPFFPRYLFARVSLEIHGWKKIYSTLGVASVLGTGERPIAVRDSVIQRIIDAEDAGFHRIGLDSGFASGDRIALSDMGLEAVFLERVDAKRVLILVKLLNQDHRLTVEIDRIKPA